MFLRSPKIFLIFAMLVQPVWTANTKDLLVADKLAKHLNAKGEQKSRISKHIAVLRNLVIEYQVERARRTNEAILWQGHIPKIKDLASLRKTANDSANIIFDAIKTGLLDKQIERLDKLIKKGGVFAVPISQHPYYHVQNSPLFPGFSGKTSAYKLTLPAEPDPNNTWTYVQLLKLWTTRGYIPSTRPIDNMQQAPSIADHPDMQTRELSVSERYHVVRSPLLISATLYVPDLLHTEFDQLLSHYSPDSISAHSWNEYAKQNRLNDDIQIRLKFNTIYDKAYLNLDRWTIYLEDSEEIGYEPNKIEERAFYPLEALKVSVPGKEIEVTDVFGTYISPIPGEKARYFSEPPMNITYVGNEKLLVLYFSVRNVQKMPIVTDETKYLKLIVQSHETDFGRCELTWELKKPKAKVRPPKD
jgi:hypothetical protein